MEALEAADDAAASLKRLREHRDEVPTFTPDFRFPTCRA